MASRLNGMLFGNKSYISQMLAAQFLTQQRVQPVTFSRINLQGRLLPYDDVVLLRKRTIIKTVNDQLKSISQIEHSHFCSPRNFVVNGFAGLIAFALQPQMPSLH